MLTAFKGGEWKASDVQSLLQTIFDRQYSLTQTVTVEVRYRTETRTGTRTVTDPDTGEESTVDYDYDVQVPYNYYICNVKLDNFDLSHLPVYMMSEDQLSLYSVYMATLGNRPDLFPGSGYVTRYAPGQYEDYDIPPEAMQDATFAAMLRKCTMLYSAIGSETVPDSFHFDSITKIPQYRIKTDLVPVLRHGGQAYHQPRHLRLPQRPGG